MRGRVLAGAALWLVVLAAVFAWSWLVVTDLLYGFAFFLHSLATGVAP